MSLLNPKEIIEKGEEESQGSSTDEQAPQDREENYQKPQEKIVSVVEAVSPSVVSIVITKDLPKWEYYDPFEDFFGGDFGGDFQFRRPSGETQKKEIGGGTGFVVGDGLILTNKHVVSDPEADYTVVDNQGEKYEAEIWALDPAHDIAFLKVDMSHLEPLTLGDSSKLEVGQSVVAIGNALGEFGNTVSTGIISGLQRTLGGELRSLIQTDAAINRGNSGGPLLDLEGKVIGVNVAKAAGAENIGFAIPINIAKGALQDIEERGEIAYPFLGVKYNINNHLAIEVVSDSPADKAGLKQGDILLSLDGHKLTKDNNLAQVLYQEEDYQPGDKIKVKVLREGEEKILEVVLGKR